MKTHEVNLTSSQFAQVRDYNYYIITDADYAKEDYILFKEVETVEEVTQETGAHKMTKVKDVIKSDGLKEGYVLLFLNGLN